METKGLRRAYRNTFYHGINDRIQMTFSSFQRQKINEGHLNYVKFVPNGNTKYSQCIENFKQKVKHDPFYVCNGIDAIMMEMSLFLKVENIVMILYSK